jgi:mycothiol synthase
LFYCSISQRAGWHHCLAACGKFATYGLGRWLKAAMIDKALRERPQVKRIRTGTADSNAPMLRINYELGFKPYLSVCTWQVETAKVLAYLGRS